MARRIPYGAGKLTGANTGHMLNNTDALGNATRYTYTISKRSLG
ncbi:hypothetical protein [Candidatus Nitrotoga sp. 1052]|nr:hypothetical protein [Candidatus Nitrotoga sp. 1052]